MSEGKKLRILRDILGDFRANGEERLFYCPACDHHKRKLSLNLEKNAFKCWVCDWSGRNIYRIVRSYGNYQQRSTWKKFSNQIDIESFSEKLFGDLEEKRVKPKVDIPKCYQSLHKNNSPKAIDARNYLYNRGLDDLDIFRWKVGFCASGRYDGRVIVPSFDLDGDLSYFVSRSFVGHQKKYLNPKASRDFVFNELFVDFDDDMILVEGVFDAIKAGENSVPLLGSTLRENSQLFQKIVSNDTPVYLALDPDAEKKAFYLVKNLLSYGIELKKIEIPKDKDVGDLTKKQFEKLKQKAITIDPNNYLLLQSIMAV